ncbi:glycosyltransferase [Candidatus Bathyarchaeota archaeon]|nr:glycosyltransferase [Candidatus Bathyarchaeota archaeon]
MRDKTELPKVSVIIPVKDEQDPNISRCLASLKTQDYSGKFEVIVIKGGNRAQARNLGIKRANGEIIAFIDSDCVASETWLSALINELIQDKALGGVGGINISPKKGSCLGKAIDFVFSSFLGSLGSASLYNPKKPQVVRALACINSAFWRDALQDIDGFDEEFELCEDTNLSYKVCETGSKLLFVPDIFVWHYRRDTIKGFAKQFFLYGMGRMRSILTDKKYASKGAIIPFIMALMFPFIAVFFPLLAAAVVIVYLAAIFVTAFRSFVKTNCPRYLLLIPSLFVVEHFSYLFGMLYGITKGKWKRTTGNSQIFYRELAKEV